MTVKPTFVQEAETNWGDATDPETTSNFDVLANDLITAVSIVEGQTSVNISGGSLSYANPETVSVANFTWLGAWTATVDSDKNMNVQFDRTVADGRWFGGNAFTWRDSDGFGDSASASLDGGAPTVDITCQGDHSAIVMFVGDWNAVDGGSRTYDTADAGAFTEKTYFTDASHYTVYGGYYADAGLAGTKTVGITAPGGQKYSIAAVEVLGGPDPAGAPLFARVGISHGTVRTSPGDQRFGIARLVRWLERFGRKRRLKPC